MATNLDFWATRDERAAKAYWESKGEMYRGLLADALRPLAPFASVLEIGCHSGPNLWAIRQRWPDPVLYGVDPALKVAMFGAAMCALPSAAAVDLSGIGFFCGSAPSCFDPFGVVPIGVDEHGVGPCDKATLPDVDVIVSCYTLAYLTPEQLDRTLARMSDTAQKGIILAEPMDLFVMGAPLEWDSGLRPSVPMRESQPIPWKHDYSARLLRLGWQVTQRKFPGVDMLDGIVIASR